MIKNQKLNIFYTLQSDTDTVNDFDPNPYNKVIPCHMTGDSSILIPSIHCQHY